MKNLYLDARSEQDISSRVERVLRDLSYAGGKVNLAEVRDLLRLDLEYYVSNDPGMIEQVVHKLRVGAKQVLERPGLLVEAIKKFELKALFFPDRKRIMLDSALPDLKKRWSETHEISHSLIPWHTEYMLGDNRKTLSPSCHERIEAEANFGAGCLIFPNATFGEMSRAAAPKITHIRSMATAFGNTITSTLWRYVENSDTVGFGAIGEHPRYPRAGEADISYFVRSRAFEQRFAQVSETQLFAQLRSYCTYRKTGPLGEGEIVLTDDNGQPHAFFAETFSNKYHVLTLGYHLREIPASVVVPCAAESLT